MLGSTIACGGGRLVARHPVPCCRGWGIDWQAPCRDVTLIPAPATRESPTWLSCAHEQNHKTRGKRRRRWRRLQPSSARSLRTTEPTGKKERNRTEKQSTPKAKGGSEARPSYPSPSSRRSCSSNSPLLSLCLWIRHCGLDFVITWRPPPTPPPPCVSLYDRMPRVEGFPVCKGIEIEGQPKPQGSRTPESLTQEAFYCIIIKFCWVCVSLQTRFRCPTFLGADYEREEKLIKDQCDWNAHSTTLAIIPSGHNNRHNNSDGLWHIIHTINMRKNQRCFFFVLCNR